MSGLFESNSFQPEPLSTQKIEIDVPFSQNLAFSHNEEKTYFYQCGCPLTSNRNAIIEKSKILETFLS